MSALKNPVEIASCHYDLASTLAIALIAVEQESPIMVPLSPSSDQELIHLATELIRTDTKRTRTPTRS
jgi:hypothetical protein